MSLEDRKTIKTETDLAYAIEVGSELMPTVVLVHADWCGPCKLLKPTLTKFREKRGLNLHTLDGGVYGPLAASLKVRSVPTVIVFHKGKEVLRFAGNKTEDDLLVTFMRVGAIQGA